MGSPTVFTGSRTKFISSKGALLKDGSVIDNDGVPNFIKNGHAEIDTTGWATYADAAQSTPVDGTGGTANVTWARTTTTPLAGAGSFIFTKDTSNRQGQGVSYTFSVDPAFRARVCNIQFDYIFTNINGSFDTSNPNLTVYIYDVTNATVIQPSSFKFMSNSQTISDTFQSSFQTSATGSQYRLIFHVATVSTSGYTIKFDNIQVTPTEYAFGTPVTDWVSFTPTGSWTTNTVYAGTWRRVGDTAEIFYKLNLSGAPNAASLVLAMPTGLTIDTTKVNTANYNTNCGTASIYDSGTAYNIFPLITGNTIALAYPNSAVDQLALVTNTLPVTFGAGDIVSATITVPILGWSSSVQTSDQTSTRVIAGRYYLPAEQSVAVSTTDTIGISGVTYETCSMVSGSGTNTKITVPVSGVYRLSGFITIKGATSLWNNGFPSLFVRINGTGNYVLSGRGNVTSSEWMFLSGSTTLKLNAGDYIEMRFDRSSGTGSAVVAAGEASTYFDVERISGPNQIAASETVALSAYRSAGNYTVTAGNTQTLIPNVKIVDTHGILNTSTGVVTIPVSGIYEITYKQAFSSTAAGTVGYTRIVVGAINVSSSWVVTDSANSNYRTTVNTHLTYLTSGQTLTVDFASDANASTMLGNSTTTNSIIVKKIGN